MKIKKFNESVDENVDLIRDIIEDFLDEFNIKSVSIINKPYQDPFFKNAAISHLILRREHQIISPAFIRSIKDNDDYHRQFIGSKNYNKDVNIIKKYLTWKSLTVEIRFDDDREKVIAKVESSIKVIESYGFVSTMVEKYGRNSKMLLLQFYYE